MKTRPFLSKVCVGTDAVENCLKIIIEHAIDAVARTDAIKKQYERHNLTPEEEKVFQNSERCAYCNVTFSDTDKRRSKCRDHTHLSSRPLYSSNEENMSNFRAAACFSCNSALRLKREHQVISFNSMNFDHLIVLKCLLNCHQQRRPLFYKLRILPRNTRKILSIEMHNFCAHCDTQDEQTGLVTRDDKDKTCQRHVKIIFLDMYQQFPVGSLKKLTESYAYECRQGTIPEEQWFPVSYKGYKESGLSAYLPFDKLISKSCYPYLAWRYSNESNALDFLRQKHFPSLAE